MNGSFVADLRYAARLLRRAPAFTTVAVATLALAMGANTAIFSIVNAALFRPLPYADADRLAVVSETVQRDSIERRALSYPDFLDVRGKNSSLENVAAWSGELFTVSGGAAPARQINGELVSSGYFELLGVRPTAGRTFSPAEADERDAHPLAIVSHTFAEQQFGSDAAAPGRTMVLNDRTFTVLGVMPSGFQGLSDSSQVWIPFGMLTTSEPARFFELRGSRWFDAIAKLKPGVSLDQARADLATIGRQLEQTYPDSNTHYAVAAYDLKTETVGSARPLLFTLLGAVGFVLLIACVNLANLLLARASTRHRETAIRAALGADRRRLARQFLAEGTLLSVIGGAAGMLIALWSTDAIVMLAPAGLPSFVQPRLDWRVLAFAGGAAAACAVLLGALPALQGSRADLSSTLKESARGSSGGRGRTRLRAALVTAEVALSLLLLAGAGLMIRTFVNLQRIDVGFRADRAATVRIALPQKYDAARLARALDDVVARVRAVPGIENAAAGSDAPFSGGSSATIVTPDTATTDPIGVRVYVHAVTPEFMQTLGIPLVAGRTFTPQDTADAMPAAIVSRKFATKVWGSADAVGKRFVIGRGLASDPKWISVVGVTADIRFRSLRTGVDSPEDPDVYFPFAQRVSRGVSLVASTSLRPDAVLPAIRAAVQDLDRDIPVSDERSMAGLIGARTASFRLGAALMSFFGGVALLLAGIGVFGVINYSVAQRRRELGVRAALGASRGELYATVLKDAILLTISGVAIGLAAAVPASRLMTSQLYGVTRGDPLTYAAITALLAGVGIVAALVPASRAARVDPMIALRAE
jgi:putative ABC transport system permease protein